MQDTPPHMLVPPSHLPHSSHPSSSNLATPQVASSSQSTHGGPTFTPVIRSALKSGSVTPISAMKPPHRGRLQTPAQKLTHRRSVSFSDGKREGPIVGLGRNLPTPDGSVVLSDPGSLSEGDDVAEPGTSTALVPSVRSKRIAEMLEGLEDTCEFDSFPMA